MKLETSKEEIYRKQINILSGVIIVLSLLIGILIGLVVDVRGNEELPKAQEHEEVIHINRKFPIFEKYKDIEEVASELVIEREVVFTNYYTGDSCGSTAKTGSGLTTDKFEVNDRGWYTYNGKVVIASSTYECLKSSYGGCATVNSMEDVPNGYKVYKYFDEIEFEVDGIKYDGIILDSCLASFWNREYQTYDIFISDKKYSFGKMKGVINENIIKE